MRRLRHSALLGKAYQEKSLDIGLDTFRSLVSISPVQEWVTKTLQTSPSSRDALTCVTEACQSKEKGDIGRQDSLQ